MRSFRACVVLSLLFVSQPLLAGEALKPPKAPQNAHRTVWHGQDVDDPFSWLRDHDNPEVIRYLKAENEYTAAMTRNIEPFAEALYKEMLGHVKQTDRAVPARRGCYYYYGRTQEGKPYPIRCRKRTADDGSFSEDAREEVVLDLNELAAGQSYLSVGAYNVSDDGNLLAYTTDTTGFQQYRLHIKDLRTGKLLPDTAERVTSVEWCTDSRTLFYTTEDIVTKRSNLVWRQVLGNEAEPVYQEKDRLFSALVSRSKDRKMLFVHCTSTDTCKTRFLQSDQPQGAFRVILPREKGHKYSVEHRNGMFYFRTNRGARNFRLVAAPVATPSVQNWKELLPHRADAWLHNVEMFQDHLVVFEKSAALQHFRVLEFATGLWHEVSFPEGVYSAGTAYTPEYGSRTFRFSYSSLVTPSSLYDYDMARHERILRKRDDVAGYDPAQYVTLRQWVRARDGVEVPLSIVHKKGLKKDGSAPLLLFAYGAYGHGMPPDFNSNRLSLLDRGVVFVIAHVRGGDEMGERWHDSGMLMKKKNSFFDFIDSAEWLIGNGWCAKNRLLIEGASAGGLLIGAVTNLRPGLFKAVHASMPFVDILNTMMDESLPLTIGEYLEWGNPQEKPAFDYIRSYSPYDNLQRRAYPAILVTTSLNDSQVMYWEPAKYVARLRTLKTDGNPLLLKCNMRAGHDGASGRYDHLKETAWAYAWLMSQVGIRR